MNTAKNPYLCRLAELNRNPVQIDTKVYSNTQIDEPKLSSYSENS